MGRMWFSGERGGLWVRGGEGISTKGLVMDWKWVGLGWVKDGLSRVYRER